MRIVVNTFVAIPEGPPKMTKQSGTKIGIGALYKNDQLTSIENMLYLYFRHCRPDKPIKTACKIEIHYQFPYLEGATEKQKAMKVLYKHTKPDCDNFAKTFVDAINMKNDFFKDDALIAHNTSIKTWSHDPGIGLKIWIL